MRTDIALVGAPQCLHEIGDLAKHSQVTQHVTQLCIQMEGIFFRLLCDKKKKKRYQNTVFVFSNEKKITKCCFFEAQSRK